MPAIRDHLNARFDQLQTWVESVSGLTGEEQLQYLQKGTLSLLGIAQSFAATLVVATTGIIVFIGLMLVLIFLFLYYRHRIRIFLLHVVPKEEHIESQKIINEISKVTQKYLLGVFTVMGILSVLNSVAFILIGVPHAVFFGVLASILNVIPYLGVWIGTLLPII